MGAARLRGRRRIERRSSLLLGSLEVAWELMEWEGVVVVPVVVEWLCTEALCGL